MPHIALNHITSEHCVQNVRTKAKFHQHKVNLVLKLSKKNFHENALVLKMRKTSILSLTSVHEALFI